MHQKEPTVTAISTEITPGQQKNHKILKKERKTTIWILLATNWVDCTREDLVVAKKGKPQERNRISFNNSTK